MTACRLYILLSTNIYIKYPTERLESDKMNSIKFLIDSLLRIGLIITVAAVEAFSRKFTRASTRLRNKSRAPKNNAAYEARAMKRQSHHLEDHTTTLQ